MFKQHQISNNSNNKQQVSAGGICPDLQASFIFFGYITLFVSSTLLITSVQKQNILQINQILVVLLSELLKLAICVIVYLSRVGGSVYKLINELNKNRKLFILYMVPAFLYSLYNNLTFINLKLFDPTTYQCLMQFRIVLTAIIYQILFRKRLRKSQWISLAILTLGCLVKQFGMISNHLAKHHIENQKFHYEYIGIPSTKPMNANFLEKAPEAVNSFLQTFFRFSMSTLLIMLQMFCSCFAGVYNEYLLKDKSSSLTSDIILQNIYMYVDSLVCNALVYLVANTKNPDTDNIGSKSLISDLLGILTHGLILIIIVNNAISGLVASIFLKKLNSILKTFASAIEVFAVAFLAHYLFNDPIDAFTMIALVMVTIALYIYSENPVRNSNEKNRPSQKDGFSLLPDSDDDNEINEHEKTNVTILVK